MSAPLISCIVPSFNSERYLAEALRSIADQTYRPIEIIVADDGSTDGTANVVASCNHKVRFVTQPTAGPAATRNLGFRHATGEFVAFLDADDLWHPRKLEIQAERFRADPSLDLCITHATRFWTEDLRSEADQLQDHARSVSVPGYATTTLLARRAAMERVGPLNPELWFSDATDWFLRARDMGLKLEVIPQALVYHRMHNRNLTRRRSDASRDEFLRIVKGTLDRRRARNPVADAEPQD